MGQYVRRGIAAGLMVVALMCGIVATGGSAAAQQPGGTIVTYPGPQNNSGVQAYGVSGSPSFPTVVNTPSVFSGYPFGYGGYYGGFGAYPYNVGYTNYGGYGSYPYNYGYANYGYYPSYGGITVSGGGCTPQVSYTPAFGYGFGCQQVATSPFSYPVGYSGFGYSPYVVGR